MFLHPGYSEGNMLLALPRVNVEDTAATSTYAVHHRTALLACQVIANNAFENNHLAINTPGTEQAQGFPDGILTKGIYYIILEGHGKPYLSLLFPRARRVHSNPRML